jgi:hypothetical protein
MKNWARMTKILTSNSSSRFLCSSSFNSYSKLNFWIKWVVFTTRPHNNSFRIKQFMEGVQEQILLRIKTPQRQTCTSSLRSLTWLTRGQWQQCSSNRDLQPQTMLSSSSSWHSKTTTSFSNSIRKWDIKCHPCPLRYSNFLKCSKRLS